MKKIILGILGVLVIAFGGLYITSDAACTTEACSQDKQTTKQSLTTPEQAVADKKSNKDVALFDVRTPEEWKQGHAKGAELFELTRMQNGELPDTPKDKPVYVYCRSGNRSAQAASILKNAGFTDVRDIGPLTAWQDAGGKIVR